MIRIAAIVGITTVLAALFAFGLQPSDPRALESEFKGRTMNDFEAPLFDRYQPEFGETLRYSEYAGKEKPLVVNFWASWCIPACWHEAPRLEAAWQMYQGQILMIGVNFQDELKDAEEFLDRFDKTYPSVRDPRGRVGIEWGVYGVPETYFIGADGRLSYKHNGEISTETLDAQIRAILE
jgi:cytochrome c biogenesis protein CcmG/thiol:disulfide interchange protein DsbE